MRQLAGKWWWVVVLPPLGCLAASPLSAAFLIAGVIWILLLIPPAVMITYFSVLLRPEAAIMMRPHTVTFTVSSIEISFPMPDDEEHGEEPARYCNPLPASVIPYGAVTAISETGKYLQINIKYPGIPSFILIPFAALPSESLSSIVDRINTGAAERTRPTAAP